MTFVMISDTNRGHMPLLLPGWDRTGSMGTHHLCWLHFLHGLLQKALILQKSRLFCGMVGLAAVVSSSQGMSWLQSHRLYPLHRCVPLLKTLCDAPRDSKTSQGARSCAQSEDTLCSIPSPAHPRLGQARCSGRGPGRWEAAARVGGRGEAVGGKEKCQTTP